MEIFLGWLIFSIIIGVGASGRGRNGFGWFVLAVAISPILALILLVLLPKLQPSAQSSAAARATYGSGPETPDTHVKCPDCAELVRMEARVCRYCGCKLVPQKPGDPLADHKAWLEGGKGKET